MKFCIRTGVEENTDPSMYTWKFSKTAAKQESKIESIIRKI